jgi:hypothetical protein
MDGLKGQTQARNQQWPHDVAAHQKNVVANPYFRVHSENNAVRK